MASGAEGRARLDRVAKLGELARELGMSTAQLSLAAVSRLTPDVMRKIEQIMGTAPAGPVDYS